MLSRRARVIEHSLHTVPLAGGAARLVAPGPYDGSTRLSSINTYTATHAQTHRQPFNGRSADQVHILSVLTLVTDCRV